MAVTEVLIHTYDMVRGLDHGNSWRPPADLADAVLPILFPDAPPGDPPEVLLYCCGRIALGDLPRRTDLSSRRRHGQGCSRP
ncbi:hypothetical protein [Speluncibacter jeojiensis]|uniref:Uncharacterized protein n=1 Tax=Speluncibacter jeojiensis TaxID=2710754 RepID=A0A9X4RG45_9ACTN|nr:hypothetical protein [Corynebacteriales bacterium D3-21]